MCLSCREMVLIVYGFPTDISALMVRFWYLSCFTVMYAKKFPAGTLFLLKKRKSKTTNWVILTHFYNLKKQKRQKKTKTKQKQKTKQNKNKKTYCQKVFLHVCLYFLQIYYLSWNHYLVWMGMAAPQEFTSAEAHTRQTSQWTKVWLLSTSGGTHAESRTVVSHAVDIPLDSAAIQARFSWWPVSTCTHGYRLWTNNKHKSTYVCTNIDDVCL